jgi:hypothetical protein
MIIFTIIYIYNLSLQLTAMVAVKPKAERPSSLAGWRKPWPK